MTPEDLAFLKFQLHLSDIEDEQLDAYLRRLYEAAQASVLKAINRSMEEVVEYGELPPDLFHCICMVAGHLYDNRESETMTSSKTDAFAQLVIAKYERLSDRTEL